MSYENWVKNSWLDKQSSDREEIGRLLGIADARLDDYRKAVKGKSAQVRTQVEDWIRKNFADKI